MDKNQARLYIIRPTLKFVNLWSANAEELLMGTAAQESKFFTYIRQVGEANNAIGGFGPFQMEPPTFNDLWNRLVDNKPIQLLIASHNLYNLKPTPQMMMYHLDLAVIMCRLKYQDSPGALPDASDVPAMAAYWKKYYNTPEGKGTEQEFIDNYNRYVAGNG